MYYTVYDPTNEPLGSTHEIIDSVPQVMWLHCVGTRSRGCCSPAAQTTPSSCGTLEGAKALPSSCKGTSKNRQHPLLYHNYSTVQTRTGLCQRDSKFTFWFHVWIRAWLTFPWKVWWMSIRPNNISNKAQVFNVVKKAADAQGEIHRKILNLPLNVFNFLCTQNKICLINHETLWMKQCILCL